MTLHLSSAVTEGISMMMDDDMKHMNGTVPFCRHGGMIMYMDGFRFSLAGDQPCLNFYFPGWTLDSKLKFWGAMMVIVIMAIMTEGISRLRFQVQHAKRQQQGNNDDNTDNNDTSSSWYCGCCDWLASTPSRKRNVVTVLHGVQACVGYILMLATMTYSVEFLISVVLGLGMGYTIFYNEQDNHVTTNPCCNFMQGEADERAVTLLEQNHQQQQRPSSSQRGVGGGVRAGDDDDEEQPLRRGGGRGGGGANPGWSEDAPLLDAAVTNHHTRSSNTNRFGYQS